MATTKSSQEPKKQAKSLNSTLETPPPAISVKVAVVNGILESKESVDSPMNTLFRHIHAAMNNKNDLTTFRTIAAVHGVEVIEE